MPFCTGETREGRRLIGADRATWVRLLVALGLAAAAAGAPHIGWTAAEFTDSGQSTGVMRTAPDFGSATPAATDAPTDEPTGEPTGEPTAG